VDVEYYRDLWVRGHSRSLKLVPFESLGAVSYSSSIVTMAVSVAVCEIFCVKEWRRSRSLKVAPFDRPYATFYSSHLTLNNIVTLKSGLRGHSMSLKLVPFESLDAVFYSPSIVTMAVSVAFVRYLASKSGVTLTGLGFVQGHWKWHHLIDRIRVPIRLP